MYFIFYFFVEEILMGTNIFLEIIMYYRNQYYKTEINSKSIFSKIMFPSTNLTKIIYVVAVLRPLAYGDG